MNEQTKRELMILVERAVRPVRATVKRKRRMREELLGHLIAVFEEELQRRGDIEAALDCARRRFGDPGELTRELQRSVSRWERFSYYIEKQRHEPGESLGHLAAKYFVITLAMSVVMALPLVLALLWRGRSYEIIMGFQVMFGCGLCGGTFGFVGAYLQNRIGRALYGDDRERSLWAAAKYGLVATLAFIFSFFLVYWALPGDFAIVAGYFGLFCCFSPIITLLLLAGARQAAEQSRHEEEWASLRIDP